MLNARAKRGACFFFLTACGSLILATGCFTHLAVDRSAPPAVDLKDYQPVAILPSSDAPGFAGSGSLLRAATQEVLKAKNFAVTAPEKGGAFRITLVATFLDYRRQKSYISSSTSQVWPGASYEYQSLPTYHQGSCEMKVRLKMLDSEKGALIWTAEGTGRGPSGFEERILRHLVEDLLKDLPLLPEKRE